MLDSSFPGSTEMARRIRERDWSATSLGPVDQWPQSLRTSVSTCLDCAFPIILWWGPDLTVLYNDEYGVILGAKHPAALGTPGSKVWAEIWDVIGPMLSQVMERGEATRSRDLMLHIDRHGYPEEAYFSFSYSPIHAEGGRIGGVFCPVIETTDKVIAERRLRTLRDLAARCQGLDREGLVYREAAAILASNPHDVPFAMIYRIDAEHSVAVLEAAAGADDPAVAPREIPLDRLDRTAWSLGPVARTGGVKLLTELAQRHDALPMGAWKIAPHTALSLPVLLPGHDRPRAILVAAVSPMRELDEAYRTFYEFVATQIASGVADAQALEEERRRAEALAAIDRAKTAFFSNVSHEFRTPLTLLLGPLEDTLANAHGALPEAASETLRVAHRNGLRLLRLVNTLLDFSRIEAGRSEASYEPTDLGTYSAELASVFRSTVERAGLRLVVDCPPSPQPAYVDRDMWEKIVLNLVSNAFKFTFEGEIEVSFRDSGAHAELLVRDTGVGIPEQDLPRVFERFHRVKQSRSRTHEGTGIGLALVHELVKLHGGEVAVQSEEGRGTRFTVRLPNGSSHLPPERIRAVRQLGPTGVGARAFLEEALRWLPGEDSGEDTEPTPGPAILLPAFFGGAASARVLVADDNADMREYLRRLLAGACQVEVVADGQAALEHVRAEPPDLVLADVMMPRLDGFELLAAIREDPRTRSVPVLLLSARAGEESRIEGLAAGADAYMVKPFSARELLAYVGSLLELARTRAETERGLRRHDRAKDEFLAMLGHELRNPIGALASALRVLEHAQRSSGDEAYARAAMLRQIRHLGRLVDDLLDMGRVTAAKIRLQREPVELGAAARNALDTLRIVGTLDRHRVTLESEPVWVDGDETRLEQVVTNLVGNAVKFTPEGGRVSVTVRHEGGCAVLEVRDDGSGIAPEALATIFDLFEQGARTLDRGQGGLGIGLTLVHRLVELHGGSVRAESDGPGRGSVFTASLPAIPAPREVPSRDAASAEEPALLARSPRCRVLVIEDHRDAREMLRATLEMDGHEVHAAANGRDGIDAALRLHPDVALIDVGLPELDGYEVARALRASPDARKSYLVALTGYGQPEDRERAREAGFDEHVVKPIDLDRLSAILAAAAGRVPV